MKFHLSFFWIFFFVLSIYSNVVKIYLIIFLLLFIHEMGHVFIALLFGYKVEKISIYPFGFSANIEHFNHLDPIKSIMILIGGIGFHLIFPFFFKLLYEMNLISYVFYEYLNHVNFSIFIFNLLPIFPLDGGRFLLSISRLFFNYRISKQIVQLISGIVILIFLIYSPISMKIILIFIGFLLFIEIYRQEEDCVEYQYYQMSVLK